MAKRQKHHQHQQQRQQQQPRERQLLLSFGTTSCIMMVMAVVLMTILTSSVASVDALSIPLNTNGNRLQQQQQQQQLTGNEHVHQNSDNNNNEGDIDNYIMQKSTTELIPNNGEMLDDDNELNLKENSISDGLTRQLNYRYNFPTLNMIKRAPGGFVGMRGKKDSYNEGSDDNDGDGYGSLPFPWQQLSPTNTDDIINWSEYDKSDVMRYKKTPTIVYGPRGGTYNVGGDAYRWQQFLQKLDEDSVRSMIMNEFVDSLVNDPLEVQNEIIKRAPTGFTGLRGKRLTLSEMNDDSPSLAGKRGLANTFVGVRGKKDVSHQTFKRAAFSGSERYFFDFWKKSSPAGGAAGSKRQRFHDLGNKFVAVRGKRQNYNGDDRMTMAYQDNGWSSMPRISSFSYLDANRGVMANDMDRGISGISGKRAPTGFFAVRGKRLSSLSDDLLTAN
uniref:Tachykinin n=1 Tax=Stomoxys calcitrans TaxID=35570 RepID=A0A1I8PR28_STOCA